MPFLIYSNHQVLEYFMTIKKLSARQARWAEYLSRYHFKLAYRTGKSNERADALSRKLEDTTIQDQVITAHQTQVLLLQEKITTEVIQDLQLMPVEQDVDVQPASNLHLSSNKYDSITLVDKLLLANWASPELEKLQA